MTIGPRELRAGGRISDRLHGSMLTLDAHLDAPIHFTRKDWSFAEAHRHETEIAQLDLPRMQGNLSGGFFVIYTAQGPLTPAGYDAARLHATRRSGEIDEAVTRFSDSMELALTADDAERIHRSGKRVVFKAIENSYPVGEECSALDEFARMGVRMAGPVHNFSNQLADSSTDAARWDGLSALGREWLARMNQLGLIVDGSHSSDRAFDQMLELSQTPVVLSHSGSRAMFDDPRNIGDDRLKALAASGGVLCFATIFLSSFNAGPNRKMLFGKLGRIGDLALDQQRELTRRWRGLDATEPMWSAGFEDYMRALLHVIEVAGVDHVGFGADFDGGGGVEGLEDVTALPRITERLEHYGLLATDIAKLWSGNLMRVLRAAEAGAA